MGSYLNRIIALAMAQMLVYSPAGNGMGVLTAYASEDSSVEVNISMHSEDEGDYETVSENDIEKQVYEMVITGAGDEPLSFDEYKQIMKENEISGMVRDIFNETGIRQTTQNIKNVVNDAYDYVNFCNSLDNMNEGSIVSWNNETISIDELRVKSDSALENATTSQESANRLAALTELVKKEGRQVALESEIRDEYDRCMDSANQAEKQSSDISFRLITATNYYTKALGCVSFDSISEESDENAPLRVADEIVTCLEEAREDLEATRAALESADTDFLDRLVRDNVVRDIYENAHEASIQEEGDSELKSALEQVEEAGKKAYNALRDYSEAKLALEAAEERLNSIKISEEIIFKAASRYNLATLKEYEMIFFKVKQEGEKAKEAAAIAQESRALAKTCYEECICIFRNC